MRSLFLALLCFSLTGSLAAQDEPSSEEQALVLFERARDAYRDGGFQRSVFLLEEAIRLHDVPPLHYNLALALQELGRWERAKAEYELFLELEPDSDQRTRVEARIAVLEANLTRLAEAEAATVEPEPEVEPVEPEPPEPPRSPSAVPWIVFGAGAAAAGVGAVFAILAGSSIDEARDAPDHASAVGPAADASDRATVANVLLIAGGAVAAAGLVWAIVDRGRSRVDATVGLGTIGLRGSF
ncbi:MAG: tetratricopeptide repeat protein [Myxococcota bacterium]